LLTPDANRAVKKRAELMQLSAVVGKEEAARRCQLNDRDIELIGFIDSEIQKIKAERQSNGQ
jgi:hypothetical protein